MDNPFPDKQKDPPEYVEAFYKDSTVNGMKHAGKSDKEIIGQLAKEKALIYLGVAFIILTFLRTLFR